jgi:hypothetical protein
MNKKKYIIIGSCILLVLLLIIVSFFLLRFMSKKDKNKLIETSNINSYYYEYIDNESSDLEKYIMFSLVYDYNLNDKNMSSYDEIKELVKKLFNYEIKDNELEQLSLSLDAINKGLIKDIDNKTFTMNLIGKKKSEIAKVPLTFYYMKNASKIGFNTYQVTYTKYVIDNPYELYNYYMNKNDQINMNKNVNADSNYIEVDLGDSSYNTEIMLSYLSGTNKLKDVKEYVKEEHVSSIANNKEEIKVLYAKKDNTFKIKKIKG